jgi:death-on-curing protein
MTRYLSLNELLELHHAIISRSGGLKGIRDIHALESAAKQSRQTFDQKELYPDIISKASILCFSIINNHPFIDGNKRIAHAAMETFLLLNGMEIQANVDEQEKLMFNLAKGKTNLEELTSWLNKYITRV